ncbi:sn-glycerol-3-phosphate import ATP-binding protein UgpC [Cobetia amphilecti]|uniref:Sn-glycerol-3-phosphate import ATP-binding protein UgpC n=1 Tax=Cobetia amphilecti TaxID=1055104 RepID=A0AAP4X1Y5_9GAMM|nr:sn-glycerol-3-phosphate import ATP-binding protein UgpC [Cobetia amphilecti]MDO6673326.1 sn-glycerol-3-phosphate import ATP-binding protein UgpC [Cobetia amphilecti]
MATLTLKQLKKQYPNGYQALHGIDLEFGEGELIVIVGPSGCGKSTLLRTLAGLEDISEGDLEISGKRVNELEPAERDIAMVFQNYALYPHMSVFDNMAYGLRNRHTPKDEIQRRVSEAAELLGLTELLDRRPKQLSGGQRQRVAMGRAIVRKPQVFLFDEPLSNLDAKLRVQMRLEIRRLQKRLKVTSVYVTHDQTEAMTLADRLVVMNGGHVEQFGTPMALYDRPASQFVAGFIGSPAMNFLSATQAQAGLALPCGTTIALQGESDEGEDLTTGAELTLGIRPEHLQVLGTADALPAGAAELKARIELVEPLGADTLAYCRLQGQSEPLVVRLDGEHAVAEEQTLRLAILPARAHLFGGDGKRLATREQATAAIE